MLILSTLIVTCEDKSLILALSFWFNLYQANLSSLVKKGGGGGGGIKSMKHYDYYIKNLNSDQSYANFLRFPEE